MSDASEKSELHCLISQDVHYAMVNEESGEAIIAYVDAFDDQNVILAVGTSLEAAADKLMNMLDRDSMGWDRALGEIGYVSKSSFFALQKGVK